MKSSAYSENAFAKTTLAVVFALAAMVTALALTLVMSQTASASEEENPVASISFTPATPYELVEGTDSDWVTEDEGDGEFCYYPAPSFAKGDKLTVAYEDGTQTAYVYGLPNYGSDYDYSSSDWAFVSADNTVIDPDDVEFGQAENQYASHWLPGEQHAFAITYLGKSCEVTVTIVANPVKSIELIPVKPYQLVEGIDEGRWFTEYDYEAGESITYYYYYMWPEYQEGDVLLVTGSDGSVTTYTYRENRVGDEYTPKFEADDSDAEINMYEIDRRLLQYGPWETGTTQYMRLTYSGCRCQVPVSVIENPVAGISLEPATPFELVENVDGFWPSTDDEDGDWDDEEGSTVDPSYFHYRAPAFHEGDVLTVSYNDGRGDVKYTFLRATDSYGNKTANFVSSDGDIIRTDEAQAADNYYKIVWSNLSQTEEWPVASTQYFTLHYMNQTCDVPVAIVAGRAEQAISASDVSVAFGKTTQLNAKVTSGDGTLSYTTSNAKVATVDKNGKVTPKKVGTATITITASETANYAAATMTVKVTVTKGANTFAAKLVKATQNAKYGKKTTLAASKVFKVTKNVSKGKVTYKKTSGNSKIKVSSAGKVTVNKGLKKGTYTVKVKLTAAATTNYKAASKTLTLKIKVK